MREQAERLTFADGIVLSPLQGRPQLPNVPPSSTCSIFGGGGVDDPTFLHHPRYILPALSSSLAEFSTGSQALSKAVSLSPPVLTIPRSLVYQRACSRRSRRMLMLVRLLPSENVVEWSK